MKKITLILLVLASSVSGQVINVHPDSTYSTIQSGINAALEGDTVLVADGIYYEQISYNAKKITVASRFILDGDSTHLNNTIIDGANLQSPNQSVVIFNYTDSTAVLAGFTIRNGRGTLSGVRLSGGGIKMISSGGKIMHNKIINNILHGDSVNCNAEGAAINQSSPSPSWVVMTDNLIQGNKCFSSWEHSWGAGGYIRDDVRFANNIVCDNHCISYGTAYSEGGGFCVDGTSGTQVGFIATSNKIFNNISQSVGPFCDGAGIITVRARNIIVDNEFVNNKCIASGGMGGGLMIANTTDNSLIRNNIFQENEGASGAGLYVVLETPDLVEIINNRFIGNIASKYAGALYASNCNPLIINNVFKDNQGLTNYGGAIHLYKGPSSQTTYTLINNSFEGNKAAVQGGAISSYNANPVLLNNIFWNNDAPTGAEISIMSGEASIAYCDIDPAAISGMVNLYDGNICQNPLFCDSTCLYIDSTSICMDMGIGSYDFPGHGTVYAPGYDIRNWPRPLHGAYDMGSYEASLVRRNDFTSKSDFSVWPNPSSERINCHYFLDKQSEVTIILYDILGTVKCHQQFHQGQGAHTISFHPDGLATGVYLLKMQAGQRETTKKIVWK